MPMSQIFNVANMSFKTIRENKILAEMSELTVSYLVGLEIGLVALVHPLCLLYAVLAASICDMYQHLMNRLKFSNKNLFVEFHLCEIYTCLR